jgi:uncharacterized protein YegP (UPF0339 family)
MHKFRIARGRTGKLRVQFLYNAEIMVWSETYESAASAKNCITSIKKNAPAAPIVDLTRKEQGKGYRFEIDRSRDGQFYTRFVARNGETMVRSERYTDKRNARKCAMSIQARAAAAPVES